MTREQRFNEIWRRACDRSEKNDRLLAKLRHYLRRIEGVEMQLSLLKAKAKSTATT